MEFIVHKSLMYTRKYVLLERAIFQRAGDAFVCKVAKDVNKVKELIELGFEYVNEVTGLHLYRKRK
jgi:hypothetical protein